MNQTIIKAITESCLFDAQYYLDKYHDVKKSSHDPLIHFLRHGHKENRQPNPFFDTKFYRKNYLSNNNDINPLYHYIINPSTYGYKTSEHFDGDYYLKSNPDVFKSGMNPLTHYICYGFKEGRKGKKVEDNRRQPSEIPSLSVDISKIKLTILVPVYNALDEVKKCLDSIILNTRLSKNIQVIVLNDCSSDINVKNELHNYNKVPYFKVINNLENLGYTQNVNKGLSIAKERDVILLNSDTIVTPNWVRNLLVAAYQDYKVGTVTAVSNNSGAFSVPNPNTNEIPENLSIDSVSRLVSTINGGYVDVPTGNGFCLYIKRELINDIGNFDKDKFPRGYGEENDFCMRALEHGWTNIVDTKTYIYHKRSASFKESKYQLIKEGRTEVVKTYPEYEGAIKAIGGSKKFKSIREKINTIIKCNSNLSELSKPKIMFVISTRSGGTPKTNMDLMKSLSEIYDCYALASNSNTVEILKVGYDDYDVIEQFPIQEKVDFASHRSREYERLVTYLLYKYNIELLHIRHICWHSILLPKLAKELMIPVIHSFHDFYTICPTVNLIDNNGNYFSDGVIYNAPNPLWNDETVRPMNKQLLKRWQEKMDNYLSSCDKYITTCESAKKIILNKLPKVKSRDNFEVISHGRDFEFFMHPVETNETSLKKIKILVPGNVTMSKGSELIKEIKQLDLAKNIEFHVIGTCSEDLLPYVTYHGKYKRDEFQHLVRKISPNVAAVFSIWPETYCHTLTESWASGLPVIGLAYGAVEERIKKHGGGWLVTNSASECYNLIEFIRENTKEIKEKSNNVLTWQKGEGKYNTVSNMTGRYIKIYQELLTSQRSSCPSPKKLGFVMKGNFPDVPPTAYVRLIDWKEWFEDNKKKTVQYAHWSSILTSDISNYDEFVIQRDAIPQYAVEWCLSTLSSHGIKYTYEIDDNLLNVPEMVDPEGSYKNYKPYFKKLIENADTVHVTNEQLEKEISKHNKNTFIRPNKIFNKRWSNTASKTINLNLDKTKINVLYYGSRTHQEDLNFVISILNIANINSHKITLYVVGCGNFEPRKDIIRLLPDSSRYDKFVAWLLSVASNFDVGIAPLVEDSFSENKSFLKCLELSKLGLPVICSKVMPYLELKDSPNEYIFTENNIDEWLINLYSIKDKIKVYE